MVEASRRGGQPLNHYSRFASHILAPALDALRGTSAMREYAVLRESQWWPQDRVLELQSSRLRQLIPDCYAHVPYYQRVMDEGGIDPNSITSFESLSRIPVTTKERVRAEPEAFLAQGFPRGQLQKGRTGGSTGTPLEFFSTRDARMTHGFARALRARQWAGVHMGDPTVFITKSRAPTSGRSAVSHALRRLCERSSRIDAECISDETLPAAVRQIEHARRPALIGYASAIYIVAAYIQEMNLPTPPVAAVLYGGEPLQGFQRDTIRTVFEVEPLSKYSSFENYEIAMECPAHRGMHVAAEDLIVEIVDDDGNPLPSGVNGRVLVTDLHNYGMPLLRYDTGDVGTLVEGQCECGRGLPLMSLTLARSGDILYTPSGKRISPLALGVSALASLPVRQFQFVQERLDRVVIRLRLSQDIQGDDATDLTAAVVSTFSPVLGDDVAIEVVFTDRIEPTTAGKHRFVISQLGPDEIPGGLRQEINQ